MDNREIKRYIRKANRLLKLVHISRSLQQAIFFGLLAAVSLLVVSRLFVFPYYEFYAYIAGAAMLIVWLSVSFRTLPQIRDAVQRLDHFTPHNELLTVWKMNEESFLAKELTKKTAALIPMSYQLFKKEPKYWVLGKWLIGSTVLLLALTWLLMSPSSLQQEARQIERDRELIEDVVEKAKEIEEQAKTEKVKEEMQQLKESAEQAETAEQALKELVKKQKELKLQQQELAAEGLGDAPEATDAADAAEKLAGQAGETQTALSNSGNPVSFPLQQTIANSQESSTEDGSEIESAGEADGSSGSQDINEDGEPEAGSSDSNGQSGETSSAEDGAGSEDGQGEGQGSGQGAGEGQGSGSGSGQGEGSGSGSESGDGQGQGDGAGTGQGSREFVTLPSRLGGEGEVEVDRGEVGDGEAADEQEGTVPAERGTARPYADVAGDYSESYFTSAERIGLPADLQKVVEQYFTSMESNE
ncbi:coiled-coil domain-containing protein [Planococcus salinus]|uniref:Uncharacterized protein n=1 Tax=Planococcus salinus TaxID=1848460 RepID=A0A3M8PAN0_9BACL|nr:hypothetical protein [Planococcus salinus]RNF40748.1 hypothetical protein EEX84_04805 [Planococcus salinus]